jgi:hypothetical protein
MAKNVICLRHFFVGSMHISLKFDHRVSSYDCKSLSSNPVVTQFAPRDGYLLYN